MKHFLTVLFLLSLFASFSITGTTDDLDIANQVELLSRKYDEKYASIQHLTVRIYLTQPNNWILVDMRSEAERQISTIPNSISIQTLEQNREHYITKNILVFCTIGERSSSYASKLMATGFKNVSNLRGGVLAWAQNQQDFVKPDQTKTRQVHVYGLAWNLLPSTYKGIWNQ